MGERTPPDVRKSWQREFLRRAATTSRHCLGVGFGTGHGAAVLLGSNPALRLSSVDPGAHGYFRPCAREVAAAHPERFSVRWGRSVHVVANLEAGVVASIDLVHVDVGVGQEALAALLAWFHEQVNVGCLLLVDGAGRRSVGERLEACCCDGRLEEVWPGIPPGGEQRLFQKICP